jgi:hypothetical protein
MKTFFFILNFIQSFADNIITERNFIIITFKMIGETDDVAKTLINRYLKILTKVDNFIFIASLSKFK